MYVYIKTTFYLQRKWIRQQAISLCKVFSGVLEGLVLYIIYIIIIRQCDIQ